LRTVIEFDVFINKAEKIFGGEEREKIVSFLSANQNAGKKLEGFGEVVKIGMAKRNSPTASIFIRERIIFR
jgi:hypothetical protein